MIYAKFNSTVTNVITNSVTQWDYGRTLRIDGLNLPTAIRIDFCISGEQTTTSRIGTTKDNVTDVVIPDSLLEQSQTIVAYVYLNDTTTGKTVRTITIPVVARPQPEEHDTPESKELFAETIGLVNEIADRVEDAETATKSYSESAKESLESTQRIAEAFNETASKAVDNVNNAGASQIEDIIATKTESVEAVKTESNTQLEQIQKAGENIVEAASIAEQNVKNVLANAIKGHLNCEVVTADDVSTVEHEMVVKVECPDGVDPTTVSVTKYANNLFDESQLPYEKTTVNGVECYDLVKSATSDYIYVNSGKRPVTISYFANSDSGSATIELTDYEGNIHYQASYSVDGFGFRKNTIQNGIKCLRFLNWGHAYAYGFMINLGTIPMDYEPYKGTEHKPSSDGTVSGVMSISPNMTILTDTEGVEIDCEYIVDTKTYIDRKFAELQK